MHLLYLSKNTIQIFKKYQKVGEVTWTPETLTQKLSQVKSTFSNKFRIILSDDFVSVSSLLLPIKDSRKRRQIEAKFQSTITQNLQETVWDYKIVARYNHLNLVQLIYISSKFFDIFRQAVKTSKVKIKLLESFSTSICRFLPAKQLTMVNYQDLLILAFNKTPIYSRVLNKKFTQDDINQLFEFSQKHFQILPQQVLFSPSGDIAFNQFEFNGIRPEYTNLNPLKGIIHSSNIVGSDAQTSRLEVGKTDYKKSSFLPKIMFTVPLILLLSIFIFIMVHQNSNNNSTTLVESITPTIAPTPTDKPISDFKIQVLNGTGTVGEAGKVTNLLSENNFQVESVGNAENFNFTQTEIEIKSSVSDNILNLLQESLEADYPTTVLDTNLPDSSEFDIVITTGQ
jgi:hypothetical protein